MGKPKVFVARPIPSKVRDYLQHHCELTEWTHSERMNKELFFKAISDVEGLLTSGTPIDRVLLDQAKKLKIVSYMSVGYNGFDLSIMKERGVIGTHTPGVLDDTVADLIVSLILGAARRVSELDQLVRGGHWHKGMNEELFGVDVHHQTVGILGMGRIGETVAKRLYHGFDMKVLYHNRRRNEAAEQLYDATYRSMDELLAESDFVVVMIPLSAATQKLIGARELKLMKPTSIFINASRGAVVDEQALITALDDGTIRAAGLDVFEQEPIEADNPLLRLPNTVLLPHIGSATEQTRNDMAMLAARNLVAGLTGETPPNIVPELAWA